MPLKTNNLILDKLYYCCCFNYHKSNFSLQKMWVLGHKMS